MNTFLKFAKVVYFFTFLSTISEMPLMAAERPSDDSIILRIQKAQFEDPRLRAYDVTVKSIDGIVTLEGTVRTLAELQFADLEAKKIRGVLGVINKLKVEPIYRLDAEIRQDLRRRIINSSMIKSENLGVRVENGVVFLTGSVGSSVEKNEASLLAGEVRGVKEVENHIEIIYKFKRPDTEIRKDVLTKLDNDVYLIGFHIAAAVKSGFVTLSGEVGNVFEKERAEKDAASLFNVIGVYNDLKVSWSKGEAAVNMVSSFPDSILTNTLADELRLDGRLDDPKYIKIQVLHGTITLTGTVPTYMQKRLAEQDVKEIAGVQWVNNLLQVKGVWRDDDGIQMDIRNALSSDYSLIRDRINFHVAEGVVTLNGNVNSENEKFRVEKDIAGIIGVKDVKDYIIVEWLPAYSDEALKDRIFDRFTANWKTWLLINRIIIKVTDGRVTLTGTVDTWAQFKEAGRITGQTDGVRSVDNRLVVHGKE
jgi:osmotically-inducible protein OsmY